MNIKLDGQDNQCHGSIGPFSSDNLGAHSIGGYIESFTPFRICRICMGTSEDIQTKASIIKYMRAHVGKLSLVPIIIKKYKGK